MAFFKGEDKQVILELAKAQAKVEILTEELNKAHQQIDRLQEALVAATAPRAYQQMQMDKESEFVDYEAFEKEKAKRKAEDQLLKIHLENLEKPIFNDADDLISSLGAVIGVNVGADSVSGNDEG